MASKIVTSVPSTSPGQARLSWRKRLIGAVDRLIDRWIEAAEHAAEQDRQQNKVPSIRPNLVFLTE